MTDLNPTIEELVVVCELRMQRNLRKVGSVCHEWVFPYSTKFNRTDTDLTKTMLAEARNQLDEFESLLERFEQLNQAVLKARD